MAPPDDIGTILPEHEKLTTEAVARCGHFSVSLVDRGLRGDLVPVKAQRSAFNSLVMPLLRSASECYVYGIGPDERLPSSLESIAVRNRGRVRLHLTSAIPQFGSWQALFPCFGRGPYRHRLSVLMTWATPYAHLTELLAATWDPFVLINLGAVVPRSAIQFARRTAMSRNLSHILFNGRPDDMFLTFVFTQPPVLDAWRIALATCRRSELFRNSRCVTE